MEREEKRNDKKERKKISVEKADKKDERGQNNRK